MDLTQPAGEVRFVKKGGSHTAPGALLAGRGVVNRADWGIATICCRRI